MAVTVQRLPKSIHRTSERGFPFEEIALNNVLKTKLGGGIPEACVHRAERAVASLKEQYLQWVEQDMTHLDELVTHYMTADTAEEAQASILEMRRVVHDMRGQGGTFGFPLVSSVAGALVDILKRRDTNRVRMTRLIRLHADIIGRIVASRIEGDGGATGQRIVSRLMELTAEILDEPARR